MKKIIKLIISIIVLGSFGLCLYLNVYKVPIDNIYLDNNIIFIKFKSLFNKEIYASYILANESPTSNSEDWVLCNDNICSFDYKNNYKLYIMSDNELIYSYNDDNPYLLSYEISKDDIYYVAKGGTYNIDYSIKSIGKYNNIKYSSSDEKIATVSNGVISGVQNGRCKIHVESSLNKFDLDIYVTDLIASKPKSYDYKKSYLKCQIYNDDETELLDEILKTRIKDAGYKTRAGVIEAARFLTLEFPYRINYFYENGRQTRRNVDGEGRYYHVGLYLNEKNYKNLTGYSTGPKMWGCSLYSNPVKRFDDNGLDCSGFVSWALLNGGFDVKDIGAGLDPNSDLTDFGKLTKLTTTIANGNSIKVGDLLHSYAAGGHIGIIIGKDSKYYYVAQALWYDEVGVIISKYKKEKLPNVFTEVVYMEDYYKDDGNYTEMWY